MDVTVKTNYETNTPIDRWDGLLTFFRFSFFTLLRGGPISSGVLPPSTGLRFLRTVFLRDLVPEDVEGPPPPPPPTVPDAVPFAADAEEDALAECDPKEAAVLVVTCVFVVAPRDPPDPPFRIDPPAPAPPAETDEALVVA
jgi:hypothetical protein